MRQFMRDELLTFCRCGRIFAEPKHDIAPKSVGPRLHCTRRARRRGVGMDPHSAKVVPEARLEIRAERARECFSAPCSIARLAAPTSSAAADFADGACRVCRVSSSASQPAHFRLIRTGAGATETGSGGRIIWSATRSASYSSGSSVLPTDQLSLYCVRHRRRRVGRSRFIRRGRRQYQDFCKIPKCARCCCLGAPVGMTLDLCPDDSGVLERVSSPRNQGRRRLCPCGLPSKHRRPP